MGGSRRRLKKNQAKVRVGLVKRKKTEKTKLPLELAEGRPDIQKRLNTSAEWASEKTLISNYEANKLVLNPNEGFGRNKATLPLKSKEERQQEDGEDAATYSDDDELRAGCNLERKASKAPPPRLTSTQRKIVERLQAAHGDDYDAMVLDTKLNPMQHSAGQLRKLFMGHSYWNSKGSQENVKHDFRGPQKPYKRL